MCLSFIQVCHSSSFPSSVVQLTAVVREGQSSDAADSHPLSRIIVSPGHRSLHNSQSHSQKALSENTFLKKSPVCMHKEA